MGDHLAAQRGLFCRWLPPLRTVTAAFGCLGFERTERGLTLLIPFGCDNDFHARRAWLRLINVVDCTTIVSISDRVGVLRVQAIRVALLLTLRSQLELLDRLARRQVVFRRAQNGFPWLVCRKLLLACIVPG